MNWPFALYLSVHEKRGACLIEYLCTSIFAPFIWVDEFHLWIISLFDLCGSSDKGCLYEHIASYHCIIFYS